jgi:uncharacterized membrane protein
MTAAFVDPYLLDWGDLLIRWLHVIASTVWIGTSFYFVALDQHMAEPKDRPDVEAGVGGEAWEIHGGGFYRIQKFRLAPGRLPETLYWFKWEAYTTWLSGFALLVVFFYLDADTYLVDPSVADLSAGAAIAISLAGLVLAWLAYDLLCRFVRDDRIVGAVLLVLVALAAWGAGELFSGRGAFIQVGAMLGTIMVASVLIVIIPAHWELIRAKEQNRPPRVERGVEAKRRSVHNTYLALPVVLTMISNHFPFLYGHEHAWLVLVALMLIGAWVRHFFVLRRRGRTNLLIPAAAAAATIAIAIAIEPDDPERSAAGSPDAPAALAIVERRCTTCHSANPTSDQFTSAPGGVVFDTPAQIGARADAIRAQAVDSRSMPLGNVTEMTDEERELLGTWIAAGAPVE